MGLKEHARRIVIHAGPDRWGRYMYTLHWWADYHPGHPAGEEGWRERGQVFYGNPDSHGVPASQQTDARGGRSHA